ncbi:MAG: acyl carrier protein [Planctomycetota bacterium]
MSQSRERILSTIRNFVADSFCDGRSDSLGEGTGLVTSGIVDSAGVVHLVEFLEAKFAISIADEDVGLANFNTLSAMADFVAQKLGVPLALAPAPAPAKRARRAGASPRTRRRRSG